MVNRLFGMIGWLGTAFVLGSIAIWMATRTRLNLPVQWDQYRYYLAWAGLVCILIYILSQWREVGQLLRGRQARYGTLAATNVLIVLGILVAVNYIGKNQNKRWDLTANKQFSLSDQTRNVLAKLDAPLHIMVFAQETDFRSYRDRLNEYEYNSKQVTTEYVDPDKKLAIANQNGIQQYGTIIVNHRGRSERTTSNTEQDISNAIIKVVTGESEKGVLHAGPRRERHGLDGAEWIQHHHGSAEAGKLRGGERRARSDGRSAQRRECRRHRGPESPISSRRKWTRSRSTSPAPARCCCCWTRRRRPARPRHPF